MSRVQALMQLALRRPQLHVGVAGFIALLGRLLLCSGRSLTGSSEPSLL